MAQVILGGCTLEIDGEATRAYYAKRRGALCRCRTCRSFRSYLRKGLTQEEAAFFEALSIAPDCLTGCRATVFGGNETIRASGRVFVAGHFAQPPDPSPGDFDAVRKWIDTLGGEVGRLHFFLRNPRGYGPWKPPKGFPEPSIQIDISAAIPWSRFRRVQFGAHVRPKRWQWIKRIKEYTRSQYRGRKSYARFQKRIADSLTERGIAFAAQSPRWARKYRRMWFEAFVPPQHQDRMRRHCLIGDKKRFDKSYPRERPHVYLWHAFSGGRVPAYRYEAAGEAFNFVQKQGGVLLFDDVPPYAFHLPDCTNIDLDFLNNQADIYLTDEHFGWTYVHTHEAYFGPYFSAPQVSPPPAKLNPKRR